MIGLARVLIFAEILTASLYIVSFKVTAVRIIAVILIFMVFLIGTGNNKIKPTTKSLVYWAVLLISFKFVVDVGFHSGDLLASVTLFLKEFVIVLMLPVFERIGSEKIGPEIMIVIAGIPTCVFGLLQIYSPEYTIAELLPQNSYIITEGITESYIRSEKRIVGTYTLAIGFALFLGYLSMQLLAYGLRSNKKVKTILALIYIGIVLVLVVATQTRSAIYGLPLAVILAFIACDVKNIRRWSIGFFVGMVFIGSYAAYESFIVKYSERSSMEVDANTYYKITANLYGTYAALKDNILIGVPRFKEDDPGSYGRFKELIREGQRKLGRVIDNRHSFNLMVTNHNMFAYYLRHYGIIGFSLLVVVLWKVYKKIQSKREILDRFMLYGVAIYFLQYVLLHNPQLLEELLLWILLSKGIEIIDETNITKSQRFDVRLQ